MSTKSDTPFNIARVEFTSFHVHGSHQWVFVEITDNDGNTGLAELAGPGATTEIAGLTAQYAERLRLSPPISESDVTSQLGLTVEELEGDRTKGTSDGHS